MENLFTELNQINVSDHVEKKMNLSYLSWVYAWQEIKKIDPDATKKFTQFDEYDQEAHQLTGRKVDYMLTPQGCYVECTVTIKGHSETEQLYVMDYKNQAVKNPNMAEINKTKQRCFVKAVALHGLGLYIYAGEDLPEQPKNSEPNKTDLKKTIEMYYKTVVARQGQDYAKELLQRLLKEYNASKLSDLTKTQLEVIAQSLMKLLKETK